LHLLHLPTLIKVINISFLLVAVWFLTRSVKYIKKLKEVKKKEPQTKVEYFRDMPDEKATPADAAFLYYFKSGGVRQNISKIFPATLLDLCLKKMIAFEVEKDDKVEDVKIILANDKSEADLIKSEQIVYEQLRKAQKENDGAFTVRALQKYIKRHSERFVRDLEKIEDAAKESQIEKKNFDDDISSKGTIYTGLAIGYAVMAFLSLIFGLIWGLAAIATIAVCIINSILCRIISSRYNGLTQKGIDEIELWQGLKRYMQDFSLLKDREVPELVLWEKYLVFATVFGIAHRVIKQLKVVYPQIENGELLGDYT